MEGSSGKPCNGCDALDMERTFFLISSCGVWAGFPCSFETQFQMISMLPGIVPKPGNHMKSHSSIPSRKPFFIQDRARIIHFSDS